MQTTMTRNFEALCARNAGFGYIIYIFIWIVCRSLLILHYLNSIDSLHGPCVVIIRLFSSIEAVAAQRRPIVEIGFFSSIFSTFFSYLFMFIRYKSGINF